MFSRQGQRRHRYRMRDNLMRFWFTFVFPNQAALEASLDVGAFYDVSIAPRLPEFVSWAYEEMCREQMSTQVLTDLRTYKIPALAQEGVDTTAVEA